MASSSLSNQQNDQVEPHAFSGIEPTGSRRKVSESLRLFDVFINHRGPDVKHTLATQLYDSLQELRIRSFLDSKEKELGDSFPSTIETAIRSAAVHIAIFSKTYAESPWCLAELVLMLHSKAKIIPVFFDVQPWELRHIEKGVYAEAFTDYENKGRYLEKLKEWKEALQSVSFIAGEEFNSDCKNIVSAVRRELERLKPKLPVAKYPVGLNKLVQDFERRCLDELVDDFESNCMKEKGKGKVQIAGIFGMGGVGKTTLSKELFNRKRSQYSRACFLFDVREASVKRELPSLQMKLVENIFRENTPIFKSIEEGTSYIGDCIERSSNLSFLVILDDIDHIEQLDALLSIDMLKKSLNSLVIVTTRDVGVLVSARITTGYNLKGMDRDAASELFCWHAFGQLHPASGYEDLVEAFLDGCGGLPLSLQVLGRHVHGRDQNYWRLELKKVSKMLPQDIKHRLKISYDVLDSEEKQIFMDIACFFINRETKMALRIWEGSGWNAQHALQTLKDKCLVEEIDMKDAGEDRLEIEDTWEDGFMLRMHDHLRDLGREIANELSGPHRVWRPQDIESLELQGFQAILSRSNWRCFASIKDRYMDAKVRYFIGNSDDWGHTSTCFLWLEIFLNNKTHTTSIPSWIPVQNLVYLNVEDGHLNRLWQSDVEQPSLLKELEIEDTILEEFPDLSRMSNHLEKVVLNGVQIPIEWWSFLESLTTNHGHCVYDGYDGYDAHATFESSSSCVPLALERLMFRGLVALNNKGQLPTVQSPMSSLLKVEFEDQEFVTGILISGYHYPNLESLHLCSMENLMDVDLILVITLVSLKLRECYNLKRVSGISDLTNLVELYIRDCSEIEELAGLSHLSCLNRVSIVDCEKLNCLELEDCANLETVNISVLPKLVIFSIRHCPELKDLWHFEGLSSLEQITIDGCGKLKFFALSSCEKVKGLSDIKIEGLQITGCPKVELLPTTVTYLKVEFQNEWKTVPGISDLTELETLIIRGCEELVELNVAGLSFLETIQIDRCQKLQNIASIEELPALKDMKISLCSNGIIRNSIHMLQRVPSEHMMAIESAAEGAESMLGSHLFSEWIGAEAVIQLDARSSTDEVETMADHLLSCGAIIYCAVVAVHFIFPTEYCKKFILVGSEMDMQEWRSTIGFTDEEKIKYRIATFPKFLMHRIKESFCSGVSQITIEKGYMVMVEKGEEWKNVMRIISDNFFIK